MIVANAAITIIGVEHIFILSFMTVSAQMPSYYTIRSKLSHNYNNKKRDKNDVPSTQTTHSRFLAYIVRELTQIAVLVVAKS